MKSVSLTVYPRTQSRRGGVKKLRTSGRIPAVIYGGQAKPQILEVGAKELDHVIHSSVSENVLLDLDIQGDARAKRLALVQEVQHHPLSGHVLHIDLHEVKEDEYVIISVPVESTGEPVGVKSGGGTLEHVLHRLKVRSLPRDLPVAIVVDVSALEIGQSIHISEITPPSGVQILGVKKTVVLSVAAPVAEVVETPAAGAAAASAEPEMIKEKKVEAGAAGAAAKPGDKAAEKKPADKKK